MSEADRNQRISECTGAGRLGLLLLCLSGVASAQDGGPRAVIYDRAVAAVEGRVITMSQLDFEARVLLVNAGGVNAAFQPLDKEVLDSSLQAVIDQRLAVREADQLEAYPLEPGELEKAIASFRSRFGDEGRFRDFLDRHDASLDDLSVVLRRSLRAQKALDGKLRLKALVTEAEAQHYQADHPELKTVALEVVRQKLFAMRFQELVRAELKQARKTTDVRLLGPFAPALKGAQP